MKTKKYWIWASVIICCIVSSPMVVSGISGEEKAQLEYYGISTLHGLTGVVPIVSLLKDEETKLDSATQNNLQTKVELQLRKAGIRVMSNTEKPGAGRFNVMLTVQKVADMSVYAVCYSASLYQEVELIRNTEIHTEAPTWPSLLQQPTGFIVGEANLEKAIKNNVGNKVNEFINDYLAANPKVPPKEENENKLED